MSEKTDDTPGDNGLIKVIGHGLRRDTGHGLGMAHRHGLHPMCGHEHGRALLVNAYKRRTILRFGRPGATGIRTSRSLYVAHVRWYPHDC